MRNPTHKTTQMKTRILATLLLAALGLAACNQEGEGGTGVVQGTVMAVMHNNDDFDLVHDTFPAAKQDVYIVYGDDAYTGDDAECGADGGYRFRYLTPGTYTVYAYSELATGERRAVSQTVSLPRGKTVTVPTLYIHKGKAYGTSNIAGQVRCTYFDKNGNTVETAWALGERVYLQRDGEIYHCDDTRVGDGGRYCFTGVQPGTYTLYAFAEDDDEVPYTVSVSVEVAEADQIYTAPTINIRLKA